MIRIKAKKILLVAPGIFSKQLLDTRSQVKHVTEPGQIFPAIFDLTPDLIIFDYEFLGADFERILRRIRSNSFYKKVKICCYKQSAHTKTDELLTTLGVNYFLYEEPYALATSNFSLPESISNLFQSAVLNVAVQ
jgi:hypothetical protein